MKLVECVPNFSEGRDKDKIQAITREIETDPRSQASRRRSRRIDQPDGRDVHRLSRSRREAAFQAIKKAAEVIDMRSHKGAHSRIGATDVCPFVPVSGVTMDDCVQLARDLGRRVADELGIPVYFYEEAAPRPERRNLATIRAGEYEGLPEKLKDPELGARLRRTRLQSQIRRDGHRGAGISDRLQHQPQHPGPEAGQRDRPEHPGKRPGPAG